MKATTIELQKVGTVRQWRIWNSQKGRFLVENTPNLYCSLEWTHPFFIVHWAKRKV
jgi:hypothetical protein